jgi:dolichol-phosphate mannosyltransferase
VSSEKSEGLRGLSVVVPTYNEAENVRELMERVKSSLKGVDFEVIVVDDSSPDGTAEIAEELGKIYGNVKVVKRPRKMGLASALLEGMKAARYDVVAVMDADLQHPPELLPKLLEKIEEGYDVVIASRYAKGGGVEGWTSLRRLMSKGATLLAHAILPRTRGVKDPVSGFFMFKRGVVEGLNLNPIGYKLLLEVLVRGRHDKVAEVPYVFRPRKRGESKLSTKEMLDYVKHLLYLAELRPLKLAVAGALGAFVNIGLLHLLVLWGLPVYLASPIAIEASILTNFASNVVWTFGDRRGRGWARRCLKYHLSVLLGAIVNYAVLLLLIALGLPYLVANIVGILLGYLANYSTSEGFVRGSAEEAV